MAESPVRALLCALLGLFAGSILGALFVPDPTSPLAGALAIVLAAVVGGGLYRTDWLRDPA